MYQRAFANAKGQVRVVNVRDRRDFTTSTANAFVERDFYTVASVDAEEDHALIENGIYAVAEGQATPILERLIDGDFLLDGQARADFAGFMALLVTRGPHFRKQMDGFAQQWGEVVQLQAAMTPPEHWERERRAWEDGGRAGPEPPGSLTSEQQEKLARGEMFDVRSTQQNAILMSFSEVFKDLAMIFQAMDWTLVTFARPCLFSGALPVMYWRRKEDSFVGLAPMTADEIIMPLSPIRALVLTHWPDEVESVETIGQRDRRIPGTELIAGHINGVTARWNNELLLCPDVRRHPRPVKLANSELGVIAA
jgi:hypothetical protein